MRCGSFAAMRLFGVVVQSLPDERAFAAGSASHDAWLTKLSCPWSQTKRASAPLFASLFFRAHSSSNGGRSISRFGVLGLVRVGDCPASCPDHEIERLKAMVGRAGFVRLPDSHQARRGVCSRKAPLVKIIGGPLQASPPSQRHVGEREEIVLIAMLGAPRRIAVPCHLVAAQ